MPALAFIPEPGHCTLILRDMTLPSFKQRGGEDSNPERTVLETDMFPLHHSPMRARIRNRTGFSALREQRVTTYALQALL